MINDAHKYWLKFASQAQAETVLSDFLDADSGQLCSTAETSINVIGDYYRPTGATLTDPEGYECPVMELVPGYHVNVKSRIELPELDQYDMKPKAPGIDWS